MLSKETLYFFYQKCQCKNSVYAFVGTKKLAHSKISPKTTPGGPLPFLPLSFSFHSAAHIRKNQNYKKLGTINCL